MGVDYEGHFGIGFKIDKEDKENNDLHDIIEESERKEYYVFEVGCRYSDENLDFCIGIRNPFEDGIEGLKKKEKELRKYLKSINLNPIGELNEIGGLEVS